jgi:hypothetical protein
VRWGQAVVLGRLRGGAAQPRKLRLERGQLEAEALALQTQARDPPRLVGVEAPRGLRHAQRVKFRLDRPELPPQAAERGAQPEQAPPPLALVAGRTTPSPSPPLGAAAGRYHVDTTFAQVSGRKGRPGRAPRTSVARNLHAPGGSLSPGGGCGRPAPRATATEVTVRDEIEGLRLTRQLEQDAAALAHAITAECEREAPRRLALVAKARPDAWRWN